MSENAYLGRLMNFVVVVYSVVIGMGSSHVDISSEEVFKRERTFGAHNYHPLPVALCRAEGEFTLLYIVER